MSEWIHSTVGAVTVHQRAGGTPSVSVADYYDGEIPFVTIEDITNSARYLDRTEKHLSENGLQSSAAWLIREPHILYSMYATVGKPIINRIPCATNQAIIALKESSEIDQLFLYYQLLFIRPQVYKFTSQTTQSNLNAGSVKKLPVAYPKDKNQQQKIATILTSIDTAIEKTESLIAKYQKIKAGLMHDLFTRGVTADGKLRPPREQAPELYQKTAIGWIPNGWGLVSLMEIASFQRGHDIVVANFEEGIYPVVSSGGVIGFHSTPTTGSPNVVIGRKGTIGKVHFLEQDFWAHDTSLFVTNFFGNYEKFVFHLCVYLDLARFGTKSGSPSLNRNDIHPIKVGKPQRDEQSVISNVIDASEQEIASNRSFMKKLRHQKVGLMQDLLTGKVPVKIDKSDKEFA